MEIHKIKKRYCTEDKVQVMFSNAPNQIICSKDGFLYLRVRGITSHHKYLSDPQRKKMPYRKFPSSKGHASHLFKFNQIYVKFTKYRAMSSGLKLESDDYTLSFLYFQKYKEREAIFSEMFLDDFECEETFTMMSQKEVEEFIYGISEEEGKYIFDYESGIIYAVSAHEEEIIRKYVFDFSDNSIIERYNYINEPLRIDDSYISLSNKVEKSNVKDNDDESWKVNTIDDVKEFSITGSKWGFRENNLVMITITENGVIANEFEIFYCGKDSYKVKSNKTLITPNLNGILKTGEDAEYPSDPDFDE